jgi:leader peptidase (prepilin peptidase) / N-methyltransferase
MFSIILDTPLAFMASVFILSLCIGSFLNVVAYRLPVMMKRQVEIDYLDLHEKEIPEQEPFNLMVPASACPTCKSKIKPWQNIPVISYLWLKGKCANCQTKISPRYPIVELITGILGVVVAATFGSTWQTAAMLIFTYFLVAMTLIDLDEYLLPDDLTLPLIWIGLIANSFALFTSLENAVFGAIAGYLSLWSIFWLFKLLTGKEGMGYGDFKLLAAIGAFLGWKSLPVVILLSSAVGAVVGIALIVILGRDKNIPIPFGPYLAAAGWIAALWGEQLTQAYFQFAGL